MLVAGRSIDGFGGYRNLRIRVKLRGYLHARILREVANFTYLKWMRTPFIAVAVPCRLGGHLILSGPMLDGTMRRPDCRRLRFRLPFRF
jgi:hypothetical protein